MTTTIVRYWNNMPTPYVVGRFNAIGRRGNLDFEAWFNDRRESDRSWDVDESEWHFAARYIPQSVVLGRRLHIPNAELAGSKPNLLVSLYGDPSFALGSVLAKGRVDRLAYRVLPTFDSWVARSKGKELSKHVLFRLVDGVKTPGTNGESLATRYGMPKSRIWNVTQSVDVEHFSSATQVNPAQREVERRARGLHGCVFIYVGRIWSGKGLDSLFESFTRLVSETPDTSLLVVGDGVDETRYRDETASNANVWFEGFVQPADLPRLYALADVFVFPTLGDPHGLVVEEAFAAGLPVICTEAAGDIHRRILEGESGLIVPPNDAVSLQRAMARLGNNEALRKSMGQTGHASVLSKSHDDYARDFEHFAEEILRMPARKSAASYAASLANPLIKQISKRSEASPLVSGPHAAKFL